MREKDRGKCSSVKTVSTCSRVQYYCTCHLFSCQSWLCVFVTTLSISSSLLCDVQDHVTSRLSQFSLPPGQLRIQYYCQKLLFFLGFFCCFSSSWWKWTGWTACCRDSKYNTVFLSCQHQLRDFTIIRVPYVQRCWCSCVPFSSDTFISLLTGGQPKAIQRGGKWPSRWSDCSRRGLEQTQAVEWVHHCGAVSGPVQIHCAVSYLPSQVTDVWDLYVPFAAPGFHQQVFPAGQSSGTCPKAVRDFLFSDNFRIVWLLFLRGVSKNSLKWNCFTLSIC